MLHNMQDFDSLSGFSYRKNTFSLIMKNLVAMILKGRQKENWNLMVILYIFNDSLNFRKDGNLE